MGTSRPRVLLLAAFLVALPAVRPTSAQTSMGTVEGTITDTSGGVLPGATVTLSNVATNVQVVRQTNATGSFVFVSVRPGTYELAIELQGFKTVRVAPFAVGVNEIVARKVALDVGTVTEAVTVTATSPLLQTASAELGHVIDERVIRGLPMQGRNFTNLLLLSPGVNPVSTAQGAGQNGSSEMNLGTEGNSGLPGSTFLNASIQGQQNRSKVYYVDGIVNTSVRAGTYVALPDIDSLQEFKVQSQSDKAEFGGVTGGVVNMTSKSGTNRFGGSAFGFVRNERLTARNPFRDANASDPPEFRQRQFGWNLGGPIARNRSFFFASYDGWRYRDKPDTRITVPAARELDGDFSQAYHGRKIYNPYTSRIENGRLVRDPFPNNVIPANLISPTMQAFLKAYMIKPTLPGNVPDNFRQFNDQTSDSNAFQIRVDHHFSARDNLFFRWTERRIHNVIPVGDRGFRTPDAINRNYGAGWFHTFGSNVVVEARAGVATQPTEDAPNEHQLGLAPQQSLALPELSRFGGYIVAGLAGTGADGIWQGIPNLGVQGPRERQNPNWNAAADLTWLRGRHTFKGGFQKLQIARLQTNRFGQINFSAEATRDPQASSTTGDAIASALLGLPSRIQGFVPDQGYIDFHTSTISGYFQDQWAMSPNLTLSYGLRYDYVTRVIGNYGFQSGPNMKTGEWLLALEQLPSLCTGQAPPCLPTALSQIPANQSISVLGSRDSILRPIKDNWGPRAGLAWQLNPRSVVRTGYALMWDSMVSRSQYGQHQYESWGWPQFSGIDTGTINTESGAVRRVEDFASLPFLAPRAAPWNSEGFYNDPDRKNAYSHQWHVELQRELTRDLATSVAYVGSYNGRREYAGRPQAPPAPAVDPATGRRLTAAERDRLRPYPHINGTFTYSDDIGMSRYNAFQAKVQRRFSTDLSSVLSYTWSQSIDTSSGWFNAEGGIGGGATVQNWHDIDANRAVSSYDIPHLLTWATIWELPVGRGKRWLTDGAASAILGGWQLNWSLIARSGQPFTPTVGGDPANLGHTGYARPNLVGDPNLENPTAERWFNAAAFAIPVNDFGNAGRNTLRAPGYWNVDLGLQRNIRVGPSRNLELRLEAFNVFNHINLGNPAVAIDNAATVARITSMAGSPRQLQLGLRFTY
jgi:Carboxypeptidase regulatory-like domain/TonB dependent receptor